MYSYPHKTAYGKIKTIEPEDIKDVFQGSDNGLYVHVPFCKTKCGYCNLFSISGMQEDYFKRYIDAMVEHANQLKDLDITFHNLTIGGGTPLILNECQLEKLFYMASSILNVDIKKAYGCIETSPGETSEGKIDILKGNHIDRVSIGIQSFLDNELHALSRGHDVKSVKTALNYLMKACFSCLNIDLIYGIPKQTKKTFQYSLDCALSYSPEEMFIYPLYIRRECLVNGEASNNKYELYLFAREYLLEHGYMQVSMRRFIKDKDFKQSDCGFSNTVSLGAGGRSYIGNIHACLPYSSRQNGCKKILDKYIESENKTRIQFGYILNRDEQKRRYIIKNLFMFNGISITEYLKLFKSDLLNDFNLFYDFIEKGYCIICDDRIKLTLAGMSLSDYLGPMFISDEVDSRMKEWDIDEYKSI